MYSGEFFFPCPIISEPKKALLKEIEVGDYLSLLKFIKNDNAADIIFFINYILEKYLIIQKNNPPIHILDKFAILLSLRSTILGPDVYILTTDNKRIKISINDILSNLLNHKFTETETILKHGVMIHLGYPSDFYGEDVDFFENIIQSVHYADFEPMSFSKLDKQEKSAILDKLNFCIQDIKKYIQTLNDNLRECVLFRTPAADITISLTDDSILHLLKILLAEDLKSIYNIAFILISKANFTWSDIKTLNPAEMHIFYNQLIAENKELEDKMKRPQSSIGAVVDSMKGSA